MLKRYQTKVKRKSHSLNQKEHESQMNLERKLRKTLKVLLLKRLTKT